MTTATDKRIRKMAAPPKWSSRRNDVEWILSDWYCPKCAARDMWQEVGIGGDYYHDCVVTCGQCGHEMCCVGEVKDGQPDV